MPRETQANAQTRLIERDLTQLSTRFDRHLEIYAQNGKEFVALKIAVDNLRSSIESNSRNYDADLNNFKADLKETMSKVNTLELGVSQLATKIGIYATIGSAVASASVSVIIRLFFY